MTTDNFPPFIDRLLSHEGGYSSDRQDPGNWTGGQVGLGELKGTKFGIAANTFPCDHLHLTRNHIARPGPGTTGEGIFLGGNFGSVIVSWSIVAGNHVHDTRTAVAGQGDGIVSGLMQPPT